MLQSKDSIKNVLRLLCHKTIKNGQKQGFSAHLQQKTVNNMCCALIIR